ncbi:MAG: TlpA family protein disulfide reductase [Pedobacter sp.]|nr:MAG: TlpA family protein disulfide reductase [Pedobacter sp.]
MKKITSNLVRGALCPYLWAKTSSIPKNRMENTIYSARVNYLKHLYVVLILLITATSVSAQESAIDITTQGIRVGQDLPEIKLDNVHNYPSTSLKTSDFRGKLIIIDFWASWCSPCISMLPEMDKLQKQFAGKIQFISVTYQKDGEVAPIWKKTFPDQQPSFPYVTGETILHKLFPHIYLPHYVWVAPNGKVNSITGHEAVTAQQIDLMLKKPQVQQTQKKDIKVGHEKQKLLIEQRPESYRSGMIGYSYFSGYIEGLNSEINYHPATIADGKRVTITNYTTSKLFSTAYYDQGYFSSKNMEYQVIDTNVFTRKLPQEQIRDWKRKYAHCLEIVVPYQQRNIKDFYPAMRSVLKTYFPQYNAHIVQREQLCLALIRTNTSETFAAPPGIIGRREVTPYSLKMTSNIFNHFIHPLEAQYLQNEPPIIDQTGYNGLASLDLKADMSSVESINLALAPYGLKFVRKLALAPMLVITDNPDYQKANNQN